MEHRFNTDKNYETNPINVGGTSYTSRHLFKRLRMPFAGVQVPESISLFARKRSGTRVTRPSNFLRNEPNALGEPVLRSERRFKVPGSKFNVSENCETKPTSIHPHIRWASGPRVECDGKLPNEPNALAPPVRSFRNCETNPMWKSESRRTRNPTGARNTSILEVYYILPNEPTHGHGNEERRIAQMTQI